MDIFNEEEQKDVKERVEKKRKNNKKFLKKIRPEIRQKKPKKEKQEETGLWQWLKAVNKKFTKLTIPKKRLEKC